MIHSNNFVEEIDQRDKKRERGDTRERMHACPYKLYSTKYKECSYI